MVKEAYEVREILKKDHVDLGIFESANINQPDIEKISMMLEKANHRLFSLEDHQIIGGLGSIVVHQLLQQGFSIDYHGFGINGSFGRSAYSAGHLYENMGLSAKKVATAIKNFINNR